MGLGATRLGAFTALIPTLPMFISTWETYHTHTLYLGYINGPTEGLMIVSIVMIISGYYGSEIWDLPLSHAFGFKQILGDLSFLDIWGPLVLSAFVFAHVPPCVKHVVQARRARGQAVAPVFLGWIPLIVFVASLLAWLGSPDSVVLKGNHLCLMCLTLSFVFGRMTTKIILAHLTRQPFPYWTVLLVPLVGGAVLANIRRFGYEPVSATTEVTYLWAYLVFSMVAYFRWAYLVITAICGHLGINCLTIPREKWEKLRRE